VTKGGGSGNSTTDYDSDRSALASYYDLAVKILQSQLRTFRTEIAPYTIIERRALATETTKDKQVKTQMKETLALVKNGNYRQAFSRYQDIYGQSNEFAAGYNAAIMTEALGDMKGAIALMNSLFDDTGNPIAKKEAQRLQSALSEATAVAQKYTDNDGHVANAIKKAASELTAKVPKTARLAVLNISASEIVLADYFVDGLTVNLIQNTGLFVVDRKNSVVIAAEKRFQLSGAVSDESAVRIGHELGADTMVLCSISGISSLRRMTVRVINLETTQVIYQASLEI
jgi:TolB-like protein